MAVPTFVDRVVLHVSGGRGGDGCASVLRERFKPLGGPDGGNGGSGGDVVLRVDPGVTTLVDYYHSSHRRAVDGRAGRGGHRHGATGDSLVLAVPDGTVVRDGAGNTLADLVGAGTELVVAAGGRGGLGNAALASPRRKAPGFSLRGEPGEERTVILELRLVADVGLVGFPNAGKSSLVAAMSRARPKVANYPFTTLVPNLGVVTAGELSFVVADVPGLVEGAHTGRGLGHDFLRHVERCAVLVHVVDCATAEPGRDPLTDIDVIEGELLAHGGLADRPRLVALNKTDVPDAAELAEMVVADLRGRGLECHLVSAASRAGVRGLVFAMGRAVEQARRQAAVSSPRRTVLRPPPVAGPEFEVQRVGELWRVRGDKPERWVRQTDFGNDEAVGYLADRLARLGIEQRLQELGAQPGDGVAIGPDDEAVVFDFHPTIVAGAEILRGPRGTDPRLGGRR